jgi:hypothetical protein
MDVDNVVALFVCFVPSRSASASDTLRPHARGLVRHVLSSGRQEAGTARAQTGDAPVRAHSTSCAPASRQSRQGRRMSPLVPWN